MRWLRARHCPCAVLIVLHAREAHV
eukprot:COSAG02_NODE_62482_length_265_cov_15.090361_1_plen_24_part_10